MCSKIFCTSGSKPMSIIRSASSSTMYVHCESTKYLFSKTSIRRPGVAITILREKQKLENKLWVNTKCINYLAAHSKPEALLLSRQTTDNGDCSNAQVLAEFDTFFFDLLSQFTSRGQNNGVRPGIIVTQTDVLGKRLNPNQQRNQESGCFS